MSSIYCTAPWNGITVRENGDVRTCCAGAELLGNLNQDKIQNILQSQKLKNIQESIINGAGDLKNCHYCIEQEKQTGLASIRQHYLKFYPNVHTTLKLKNLDIRWNNLCNLGCVYCGPMFSSVWEDRLLTRTNAPVKLYQDDLLDFIIDNIDQVDEIMLVGGEPMLMKQNYELFKQLPESTEISIITNFSYELDRLPCFESLLRRPKEKIKWNLSLENSGQKFEYVRNGADWSQVQKNFKVLQEHWGDNFSVQIVYSVFTAFDLEESIDTFHKIGVKKFHLQTYYGHPALNVFSLPEPMRNLALNVLNRSVSLHYSRVHQQDKDLYPFSNYKSIADQLTLPATQKSISKKEFYNKIEQCDNLNRIKFKELWPDVIDLVDLYLD